MATRIRRRNVRQIYRSIKVHEREYTVETMCRLLSVARSGYYAWLSDRISKHAQEDARLLRLIRASVVASDGIYGSPRVFLDLREAGSLSSIALSADSISCAVCTSNSSLNRARRGDSALLMASWLMALRTAAGVTCRSVVRVSDITNRFISIERRLTRSSFFGSLIWPVAYRTRNDSSSTSKS